MFSSPQEMQALRRVAELEPPLTELEGCLGGLAAALRANDPLAIESQATELHRALARAVGQFTRAARDGGVPGVLRQRLALAGGQAQEGGKKGRAERSQDRSARRKVGSAESGSGLRSGSPRRHRDGHPDRARRAARRHGRGNAP